MKKYKTGIYIGKFYPFHNGHLQALESLIDLCEKVFVVFNYDEKIENILKEELDYNIDERVDDTKKILKGKNVEIIKFIQPQEFFFPKDHLEIRKKIFKQLKVQNIDLQVIGAEDEEKYKNYTLGDQYITSTMINIDKTILHATLIRNNYDKYKYFIHPIIRKRLDEKLNKQKYICLVGKSCTGKSYIGKYIENSLDNCLCLDIDKIIHKSHKDREVKNKIVNIVGNGDILDENENIDRKKLGKIVFDNKELKDQVYRITWQYVDNYIQKVAKENYKYIILDWYNINTKIYWDIATCKIVTVRDEDARKKEVIRRDNITLEYLELREKDGESNYKNLVYDYKVNFKDMDLIEEIINILK